MNKEAEALYSPLAARAQKLTADLNSNGFESSYGWYNFHSVVENGVMRIEHYPIPVISVAGYGDLGLDFDQSWFEFTLTRAQALSYSFAELADSYRFEVYGCEQYEADFYNQSMPLCDIAFNISGSQETHIHVCVHTTADPDITEIRALIATFKGKIKR